MSVNTYDLGDLVRITGTFKNQAGALIDPTIVKFSFKNPAGTITIYTYLTDIQLVRSSTGIYYVDLDANASGEWFTRFYSTGTGQAAIEEVFYVNPTNLV